MREKSFKNNKSLKEFCKLVTESIVEFKKGKDHEYSLMILLGVLDMAKNNTNVQINDSEEGRLLEKILNARLKFISDNIEDMPLDNSKTWYSGVNGLYHAEASRLEILVSGAIARIQHRIGNLN